MVPISLIAYEQIGTGRTSSKMKLFTL